MNCYTRNLNKTKYNRPKKTFTDQLQTTKAMKEKLKNYERVDDIDKVPLRTHLRYVTWKDGKQRFCLGGFLIEKHKDYVKLTNNSFHWSVQKIHYDNKKKPLFKTVFFSVISYKNRNKEVVIKQQKELEKYKMEIEKLKKENNILRKKLGIGNIKII